MRTLQFHNFSIKGDSRWAGASRVTGYAPVVVLVLLVLSIIQVSLGAVWLSSLESVSGFVVPTIPFISNLLSFIHRLN